MGIFSIGTRCTLVIQFIVVNVQCMKRGLLILTGCFSWLLSFSQKELSVEGLSFNANPYYEVNIVDAAGGAYPIITVKSLNATVNVNSGINYRGKNYGYQDFGGQLKYYFDAIKVTALLIRFEYSGTYCDHTPSIEASFAAGEKNGNALCTIPKGGSIQITNVNVKRITGTTGIKDLQRKIDELEQNAASEKATTSNGTSTEVKTGSGQSESTSQQNQNNTNGSTQSPVQQQVSSLIIDGNALYYQGRYKEAIAKYDEVLRLDPGNVQATNNRQNAVNASNDQVREQQKQAQAEVKQNTVSEFTDVSSNIAQEVLSEKGGRFGLVYASDGDLDNLGITFGNSDVLHMNLAADFSAFQSMFISMDLMGINPFRHRDFRLVPATGLYMQFQETDENGDYIEGTPDFTAIQLGLTGLIDMDGFFIKIGGLWNVFYFNTTEKPVTNFTLMLGIGMGKD